MEGCASWYSQRPPPGQSNSSSRKGNHALQGLHLLALDGAKIEGDAAKRMLHRYRVESGIPGDKGMEPDGERDGAMLQEMEAQLRPPPVPVPGREAPTTTQGHSAAVPDPGGRASQGLDAEQSEAVVAAYPSCQASSSTTTARTGKTTQTSIRKWAENTAQKRKALFRAGVPLNFVRQEETKALHDLYMELGPQKVKTRMTSFDTIRTIVLDAICDEVKQTVRPVMDKWDMSGCTLITDGCTDIKFRPVLNFIGGGEGGAVLMKVVDTSNRKKNAMALAKLWEEVIRDQSAEGERHLH
ncbi:hypothetical protein CBR_g41016 [Chara braunii]|uniref:DUF659 domain-containing protein n=1 Tax=Chara braunii TaxID=69332 RepID=A0A388LV50_CHABU|nr:hypothetical protein CBR_g41016 [Chara braunii]|eukprot:GBG86113.1 hypothetical protein CBR_g41016 [Chara braunii]